MLKTAIKSLLKLGAVSSPFLPTNLPQSHTEYGDPVPKSQEYIKGVTTQRSKPPQLKTPMGLPKTYQKDKSFTNVWDNLILPAETHMYSKGTNKNWAWNPNDPSAFGITKPVAENAYKTQTGKPLPKDFSLKTLSEEDAKQMAYSRWKKYKMDKLPKPVAGALFGPFYQHGDSYLIDDIARGSIGKKRLGVNNITTFGDKAANWMNQQYKRDPAQLMSFLRNKRAQKLKGTKAWDTMRKGMQKRLNIYNTFLDRTQASAPSIPVI